MKKDYTLYLKDILNAMESIEEFTEGMSFEDFKSDDKTVSSVLRKFEIIGEASKRIPESIKKDNKDIPWEEMAKMRDKVIHFYSDIDHKIVWKTIENRIPEDKRKIKEILGKLD